MHLKKNTQLGVWILIFGAIFTQAAHASIILDPRAPSLPVTSTEGYTYTDFIAFGGTGSIPTYIGVFNRTAGTCIGGGNMWSSNILAIDNSGGILLCAGGSITEYRRYTNAGGNNWDSISSNNNWPLDQVGGGSWYFSSSMPIACDTGSGSYAACNAKLPIYVNPNGPGYIPPTPPVATTSTQFLQPYNPSNGSFATTSPQIFSYQYFFNDAQSFGVYNTAGIQIQNLTEPTFSPAIATSSIAASGLNTYTASTTLRSGDSYLWRPKLSSNTGTSSPLYGSWYSFQSTSTPAWTPYVPYTAPTTTLSTTTNPIPEAPCSLTDPSGCFQNTISYLFYPTVDFSTGFTSIGTAAQTKIPFVYAYQIIQVRQSLLSEGTTSSSTIAIYVFGTSTADKITLLSPELIAAVPYSDKIKFLASAIMLISMAEYTYFRVLRMHDTNTPT